VRAAAGVLAFRGLDGRALMVVVKIRTASPEEPAQKDTSKEN
jgi:hypothetical protein